MKEREKVSEETLVTMELGKHLPELQRMYWEENIGRWEARIEKLPPDNRKDSRMLLLFEPSFPFREKLWQTIISEHYLSNEDLMGVMKFIPELREKAGEMLFERHPVKSELRLIMVMVPELRAKAEKLFFDRKLTANDMIFLMQVDPSIKDRVSQLLVADSSLFNQIVSSGTDGGLSES